MLLAQKRHWNASLALHGAFLLFAFFGLPKLLPQREDPQPLVMSVELLPISELSNIKPSDQPIQEQKNAPAVKNTKPIPPTQKEAPKPPEPKRAPLKPAPQPEVEEKHFDPNEGAEPKPEPKPEPPPPTPKPQPKQSKSSPDEFAALLSRLQQENTPTPKKTGKDAQSTEENKTRSDAPYDASKPLSISERDAIRSQFIPCWRVPAGAKDAASLIVRVKVELMQDGTVRTATVASDQLSRYSSDSFFRAAADAAVRAVYKCSPLKNLPPDKFGTWHEMELTFDPSQML